MGTGEDQCFFLVKKIFIADSRWTRNRDRAQSGRVLHDRRGRLTTTPSNGLVSASETNVWEHGRSLPRPHNGIERNDEGRGHGLGSVFGVPLARPAAECRKRGNGSVALSLIVPTETPNRSGSRGALSVILFSRPVQVLEVQCFSKHLIDDFYSITTIILGLIWIISIFGLL